MYYELAQKQGLTIRQLYKKIGMAQEHKTIVGTAADVVDDAITANAYTFTAAGRRFGHPGRVPGYRDRRCVR